MNGRFEIYQEMPGTWRWRLYTASGVFVAISDKTFSAKSECRRAAASAQKAFATPVFIDYAGD